VELDLLQMPPLMPPRSELVSPYPKSNGSELNVIKIPAYAWHAIYSRASLGLVHVMASRRGFA
jgi:hypothetical protein